MPSTHTSPCARTSRSRSRCGVYRGRRSSGASGRRRTGSGSVASSSATPPSSRAESASARGRAIVREPRVFLFDEPLSNLDAKLRMQLRAELLGLHRQLRATMIYVTHDQVEAMTMGQRIAVLHEGRLRQLGTPGEVYERPADEFVARFIGSPGMNILIGVADAGRGKRGGGGAGVRGGGLRVPLA